MSKSLTLIIALSAFVFCSCKPKVDTQSPEKIVKQYVDALNASNYKQIKPLISDTLKTTEGGFILTTNSIEYFTHFQWDSVFSPSYRLLEIKVDSFQTVEVTLSKICKRIRFLHDTATVYKAKIYCANHQITQIDNTELVVFDTLKWSSRRDTLVAWIKRHHPALDGFIYDQTPTGAKNYLKAIELYQKTK